MTEPLGRSQVLPYLVSLARAGVEIHIVSFEPAATTEDAIEQTGAFLRREGIRWSPGFRSPAHGLLTKLLACRSGRRPRDLAPRTKLLFDCRGMRGDEYVDVGHWTKDRVEYKLLKQVERRLFHRADGVVVLTKKLASHLRQARVFGAKTQVQVIPCCADLDRFSTRENDRAEARASFGISPDRLVCLYSGSLGTFYREDDMAHFFAELRRVRPDALFLALTRDDTTKLRGALSARGVPEDAFMTRKIAPEAMGKTLLGGDIGLSFIISSFSKMGSSPTKVAEYFAAGMPAVLNGDIGDQGDLASEAEAAVVVDDFSAASIADAVSRILPLAEQAFSQRAPKTRAAAERHFSLATIGGPRYRALYEALAFGRPLVRLDPSREALSEIEAGNSPRKLIAVSTDAAPPSFAEGCLQMCGIFGAVFLQDGKFPRGAAVDVDAALHALEHRGPDYAGQWRSADAAFGHTRLSIVDLSPAGHQPMVAGDASVVVLLNGEIYNFRELRDQLVEAGHSFRSRSDTEVVLEGYREWGIDVIQRLDGMFAIAIWDVREKRLVLARDRVGKKPVFYTESSAGQALAFASETDALFAAGVPCEPNLAAFPSLFSGGSVRAPATRYHGIAQLPPAHLLVVDARGSHEIRRYWSPPFHAPRLVIDEEEAAREVRRLVDAAVERRIQADVPVGALLSGGVDSTITAGVMARAKGSRLHTFAVGFSGDSRFDETSYARLASSRFGTEHHELILEPSSFASLPRLVDLHDGPFADASAIPMAAIAKRAKQTVTVALSGDGGDEVFCGYSRFVYAEASERTPRFLRDFGAQVARLSEAGEGSTAIASLRSTSIASSVPKLRRRSTRLDHEGR
ncbi:hypothetical protein OUZ56_032460 [Daphnia magna]|uniref:Asparagine synthetase [glutamine-hydrolyzing] n=1 Tax=Daphnia magna TaxID=35525 RepID=A0ABR0B8Y3_9CRUS|nr:hypothetical protein OUZ56_032460 [Daphnia magna]